MVGLVEVAIVVKILAALKRNQALSVETVGKVPLRVPSHQRSQGIQKYNFMLKPLA